MEQVETFVAENVGESLLATVYLLLEKDGLLPVVFYDGVPALSKFLEWATRSDSKYVVGFVRPTLDTVEIAGVGWVWQIQNRPGARRGDVGMVFLRKFQDGRTPLDLTGKMLGLAFGSWGLDLLTGVTPVKNPLALRFARKLGFRQLEPIPSYGMWHGEPCAAVVSYLTAETWRKNHDV